MKKSGYLYSICDKVDNPNYKGTGDCDVKVNKGNECSSYLQYIVNNYDNLPDRVAFIHGHNEAWHQKKPMEENLHKASTSNLPFGTLNGTVFRDHEWENAVPTFRENFPEFCSHKEWTDKIDMSSNLVHADCCAQFVVDRETIQRLPREAWSALQREVLSEESGRSDKCFNLERMWAPLFGRPGNDPDPMQTYIG